MKNPSFATRWNLDLIDALYGQWQANPESVDAKWQAFFEGFELAMDRGDASPASAVKEAGQDAAALSDYARKQARFVGAIYSYRSIGHTQAHLNPLDEEVMLNPRLSLARLGFDEGELDEVYDTGNYMGGMKMSVREMISRMSDTYCGSIGVEYIHIQETPRRRWLQAAMEPILNQPETSREKKLHVLDKVVQAETFEKFLHTRYVGQKRFGLEGGETLIAAIDALVEAGPSLGVEEMIIGMAHRGRLNVLANILGKSYEYIFHEFSANYIPDTIHGDGDVKYHLGFDSIARNSKGESMILQLAANPSHLEAVNSVVEGRVRARQRMLGDTEKRSRVIPLLIHGDAAFAGQGVIAEVLNFSQLKGYTTGGTVHIVINNQIGFTTDPSEARSSRYCTDVAKMIEAPVFHVNGDDPLAVVWVTELALRYRQEFHADVVVDMYCYRRHGHNEADEPSFTQPTLYRKIEAHPLVSEVFAACLKKHGFLSVEEEKVIRSRYQDLLDRAFERERERETKSGASAKENGWKGRFHGSTAIYQPPYSFEPADTGVNKEKLDHIARALTRVPDEFKANPKIVRQLDAKRAAYEGGAGIDWAFAESLAWGSLLLEGTPIRLSGQDSERGTFSQRHAVLYDSETRTPYIPLLHMEGRQAQFCIHNSLLSEAGVLGFDYGYSLDYPNMLIMWEAQFGDFANGAQVMIDQFIVSSESKWQRISGLVMLLPHGYEGQGPEHSSARLERFLQLCAEDNIQVCNLTTPAQYFHALRRQMRRDFRKPLILMAPKSMLRHKECVSAVADLTDGHFNTVLDDPLAPAKADRLILCSGKVFYDLAERRRTDASWGDTAIVRIEQLYPFDADELLRVAGRYADTARSIVWCQEEPQNMGAWSFVAPRLEELFGRKAVYAGRKESASPAVGSLAMHKRELAVFLDRAGGVQ
ncbi:MAG: 2-oxoglutarate dehydrogenase E1 component [Opitutales bacterium]|nr:2-oxoglutarate dehydrogenase E1 component [Opitutales bacterium]